MYTAFGENAGLATRHRFPSASSQTLEIPDLTSKSVHIHEIAGNGDMHRQASPGEGYIQQVLAPTIDCSYC